MKQIDQNRLDELVGAARLSPRLRMNANLHDALDEPVQRLAIAMQPDTIIRPHRHQHTWELLLPLRGRFVVLHFDDHGQVTDRVVLGETCHVLETPAGCYHAVLSLDDGGVIFEVKHGPYRPFVAEDFAPGYQHDDAARDARLNAWYEAAQTGDQLWT